MELGINHYMYIEQKKTLVWLEYDKNQKMKLK